MNPTTYAFQLAALAQLIATAGPLHTAKVILFTNVGLVPNRNTKLTDLTQPTFTGYLPVSVATWGTPYIAQDNNVHVQGGEVQFQPTDATTPTTVTGWALTDTGATQLLGCQLFLTPVSLPDAEHACVVLVDYGYGD
jgi:hypothetical protein